MESLTQLLSTCSLPEKAQLLEFAKIKNSPSSKKLILMQLLVSHPGLSDAEYAQKIYKKPESAAYFQLKKRVKDEFEDLFVLLKPSGTKKEIQLHIECSELLLKSQLILARGIRCEGSKLLERGLKMAIKHSFHDLVLTIYSTAIRFEIFEVFSNTDLPELEIAITSHLQLLIRKYHANPEKVSSTKNQHLMVMIGQLDCSWQSRAILDGIYQSILDKEYKNAFSQVTKAESALSYDGESGIKEELLIAKMSIFLALRDYSNLMIESLAKVNISNFSTENAEKFMMYHWYASFYLDNLGDAQQLIRRNVTKTNSIQRSKWAYFEACVYFKQRNFSAALKQIHSLQKEVKSIPNYYLGSKMLEIMVLFEQNDLDWLEFKVENLRKLISRNKGEINKRTNHAFLLVLKLQKSLYNSSVIDLAQDPLLLNLQNEKTGMEWTPDSFELIRYDAWIITLLNRQVS
jgi:hypothetical protein